MNIVTKRAQSVRMILDEASSIFCIPVAGQCYNFITTQIYIYISKIILIIIIIIIKQKITKINNKKMKK